MLRLFFAPTLAVISGDETVVLPKVILLKLTVPAVSVAEVPRLKAMSPPFNFSEKPEFIAMETCTPPATSVTVTVPMVPETPRLLKVRLYETGDALARGAHAKANRKATPAIPP